MCYTVQRSVYRNFTPWCEAYLSADTPEDSVTITRCKTANAWGNGCSVQFFEIDARSGKTSWFDHPAILRARKEGQFYQTGARVKRDAVVVFFPEEMTRQGDPSGTLNKPILWR